MSIYLIKKLPIKNNKEPVGLPLYRKIAHDLIGYV